MTVPPARSFPTIDPATAAAIARGEHGDPFAVLGMHRGTDGVLTVRAFLPGAEAVAVMDAAQGADAGTLARVHEAGLFAGRLPDRAETFRYRLRVTRDGSTAEIEDPYRFGTTVSDHDQWLFAEGRHFRLYDVFGAHPATLDGIAGVRFAVWAPNARRVSVVGDFNGWDGRVHVLRRRPESGIWEMFLPGIGPGAFYKYEVVAPDGRLLPLKSDPFAFSCEPPPRSACVVAAPDPAPWRDEAWMSTRGRHQGRDAPIAIYEVHLGSWRRAEGNRYLTYAELADQLVPYVRDMGFTHVELMPVSEYPFDGSWGYQPIGLFAPTARYGTPAEFRAFVDRCHGTGIGVILDWVPGHFPTDTHGLGAFDGTHLYEHADPRQGRHMDWDTLIYNYGRREVANFLTANALYWAERYHADGLRVDGVASMLYLDYSRLPGEWIPNEYGGNENLEAVGFLKSVNEQLYGRCPGIMTAAEESTAWPGVSHPTYAGGLGFGYKWNMGWMNDTLRYMSREPVHRRFHHNDMTFGLLYAFSENFILPLSHDEVVHGKGSLLGRMPGDRWQKFANLRAYFAFMYTQPGKKLLFMGGEFAQANEWNHDASLDWHLLEDPFHRGVQALVRDLNRLYRSVPALHRKDCSPDGFEWIAAYDADASVFAYLRRGGGPDDHAVVVCNFTPVVRRAYRVGVPAGGDYVELLNTDAEAYGGGGLGNLGRVTAEAVPSHGRPCSLSLTLPPLAAVVLAPAR